MGVLHGNRDRVEPPGPNLAKSRDPLADPIYNVTKYLYPYYEIENTEVYNWNVHLKPDREQ